MTDRIIAGHEAGHAVVARHFNFPVEQIVIEGESYCIWRAPSSFDHVVTLVAGRQAEMLFFDHESTGSRADTEHALQAIDKSGLGAESIQSMITQAGHIARSILINESDIWARLADQIMASGNLSWTELSWFNE